jgi:hypothetical protein
MLQALLQSLEPLSFAIPLTPQFVRSLMPPESAREGEASSVGEPVPLVAAKRKKKPRRKMAIIEEDEETAEVLPPPPAIVCIARVADTEIQLELAIDKEETWEEMLERERREEEERARRHLSLSLSASV